jgi:hypothetical protein
MTEIPNGFNDPGHRSLITAIPGSSLRLRGNRRSARRLLFASFIVIALLFADFLFGRRFPIFPVRLLHRER